MRKTLDKLISWTGFIMAAVLLVAGGLLIYASNFVANNVKEQLSQQNITMPAAAALETQEQKDALLQYAGQQMENGNQAKAFADHYILVHMNTQANNKTYSDVSGEYLKAVKDPNADPKAVAALGELRQSLFMGNTLRGLLLNAYAFGTMGTIALYAGIAALIAAAVLLVLAILGLQHAKKVDDATVDATPAPQPVPTA
jgi:NADH:ubiquinone oxidoreductase subunit 3 (subunit A)